MNLKEISQEERDLWRFEASDECGTPSEDDERILRLLKALEASEADLERSCEETRANFSELYRMANEVVPELKKRLESAEDEDKRLTKMVDWLAGRELTVDGFAAPCQCESDYFQGKKAPCGERPDEFCSKFNHRGNGACWIEAARRAVAAGEETCQK